jgi:hypothetical protein
VDCQWQDGLLGLVKSLEKWLVGKCGLEKMWWGTRVVSLETKILSDLAVQISIGGIPLCDNITSYGIVITIILLV